MRGSPVPERPRKSSPAIADATPRRPGALPPAETKRREPRDPRLGASPEGGVPGSADRSNAVPGAAGGSQDFQASRRERSEDGPFRGGHAARPPDPRRGRNAAASPCSRTRSARRGPLYRRSRPPRGGGSRAAATPGAEMSAPRGGTDEGAGGARRSPLAMPVGNAAEGVGAANRAAVPNRGHDEIHRADPDGGGSGGSVRGMRPDQRNGQAREPASLQRGSRVVPRERRLGQSPRPQLSLPRVSPALCARHPLGCVRFGPGVRRCNPRFAVQPGQAARLS
jgi:hypothetical protein